MTALLQKLGLCIRKNRTQRGLSQEKLAAKADLHRTYIGALERGERNPTILTILKIAHALDMSLVEFLANCKLEEKL